MLQIIYLVILVKLSITFSGGGPILEINSVHFFSDIMPIYVIWILALAYFYNTLYVWVQNEYVDLV